VIAQGYVLPHQDKLDPSVYKRAAGPDGWTAQQGFYVYRNQRLLVAGSWLGLGHPRPWTKEEGCRLARLRVDLPNSLDSEWKIDIRKSTARPPAALRRALGHLVEQAGAIRPDIEAMLRIIEETVPVQRIWLDTAEARETPRTGFTSDPPEEVSQVLRVMFRNMTERKGLSAEAAIARLLVTEPFQNFPDLVRALALSSEERAP
jgi:hypothetical protein